MPAVVHESPHDPAEPGGARWWQEREERLGRRRPRTDGLTVERIIAVAIDLVDDDGLDALTVRNLAARLGTGSATLYRHVASRGELLVLLVDHVLGEVGLPDADLEPRHRVEALARELRRVLLRHPHLVPALRAAPLLGPNAVRGMENGLANFLAGGYPLDVALPACLALIDYVLGSVFFDSGRARPQGAHLTADAAVTVALDPMLTGQEDELALALGTDVFAFGLRTFLDGLEGRREPQAVGGAHASDDR
jgi:AcrR family transcriptional regulator